MLPSNDLMQLEPEFFLGQVWVSCASVRLVANDGTGNDYNEGDSPIYTEEEYEELEGAFQN